VPSFECFISYCWRNSKSIYNEKEAGFADPREIARELSKLGLRVWLDIDKLGDQGLFSDIAKGLQSAKLVLAFISEEYANSENCKMELRHALKNLRKPVIVCAVGTKSVKAWNHTEVSMLVADCVLLRMRNSNKFKASFERLLKEIQHKLQPTIFSSTPSFPTIPQAEIMKNPISNIEDHIEALQRAFLAQITSASFPRVFSWWWRSQTQSENGHFRFLCEKPGEWHFVGTKSFRSDLLPIVSITSYIYPLVQILEESSICDATTYLQNAVLDPAEDEYKCHSLSKIHNFMKTTFGSDSVEEVEKCVNMKQAVLPTGEVYWLCDAHQKTVRQLQIHINK